MNRFLLFLIVALYFGEAVARRHRRQEDGEFWWLNKEEKKETETPEITVKALNQTVIEQIIEKGPPVGAGSSPHPGKCVCVPYHTCSADGEIITDGAGIIDIRIINKNPGATAGAIPAVEAPKASELVGGNCPGTTEVCCTDPTSDANKDLLVQAERYVPTCGVRNSDGINIRIVGFKDQEAQYGEFPWMVAILNPAPNAAGKVVDKYVCGGSLIHPQVVLTAAHCVANRQPTTLKVRLGEWDTQSEYEFFPQQDVPVSDMIVHEGFIKANLFNDIALLFLEQPVNLGPEADTICMPLQDEVFDGSRCFASGWGKDQFGQEGKYQHVLKKVDLPVVTRPACQTSLRTTRLTQRFVLHDSFICAGGEGKDTCKGDGGSPLVCPVKGQKGRYVQAGIVAWGIGCGENSIPGVYVNVPRFVNWIEDKVSKKLNIQAQTYFKSQLPK